MRTAIDSNVISSIWSSEPTAAQIVEQLGDAREEGSLVISPFAFAELHAHPAVKTDFILPFLDEVGVAIDLKLEEGLWSEAGLRFARYAARRRLATAIGPRRLLADFLIGSHALLQADRFLTLDQKVYRQDFPELLLM